MLDDVESALAGEGFGFSLIWRNDWFFTSPSSFDSVCLSVGFIEGRIG
jgi:hypothetical protein